MFNPSDDSFNNDPFKSGVPFATLLHDESPSSISTATGDMFSLKHTKPKYSMLSTLVKSTNYHSPLKNDSSSLSAAIDWFATPLVVEDNKDPTYFSY